MYMAKYRNIHPTRHSRESGNPLILEAYFSFNWIPAFAGMTLTVNSSIEKEV